MCILPKARNSMPHKKAKEPMSSLSHGMTERERFLANMKQIADCAVMLSRNDDGSFAVEFVTVFSNFCFVTASWPSLFFIVFK